MIEAQDTESGSLLHSIPLGPEEFEAIRALVHTRFGIALGESKRSLVLGRLQKVVKARGFSSFQEYYRFVVNDSSGDALAELATRISTNHTFFFREKPHFDFFNQTALPGAIERAEKANCRDLRIWSAGCSSGEEPYTLIILLMEYFGREYSAWRAGVLATDISSQALQLAKAGEYGEERLELLPAAFRSKYFTQKGEDRWEVNSALKREVTFAHFNLMSETFRFKQQFDMIFCRNVMIYFDTPTREALVRRFYDWVVPGGYLFIGHSESLRRDSCPFRFVLPAVYQKDEQP